MRGMTKGQGIRDRAGGTWQEGQHRRDMAEGTGQEIRDRTWKTGYRIWDRRTEETRQDASHGTLVFFGL